MVAFGFVDGDVAETQQIKTDKGSLLWIEIKCKFGEGTSCSPYLSLYNASLQVCKLLRYQNCQTPERLCFTQMTFMAHSFLVFCFLFSLLFFHFTAAIFWPAIMQNSQFFSKADVCQNGNLIDYLLVSKAFNHSFGRASKHALSQERVVWARKALALKRGCHSD